MSVQDFENKRWGAYRQKKEFRHSAALALASDGPLLDIGCGDGLFLSLCKEKGIEAEGVDVSDTAVAHCAAQGLQATRADLLSHPLPFKDGTFHTVVALDVLEHVYTPETLLAEMKRVSAKNLVIGVPNFSSLPARLQTLFGKVPENNRPHKGHVYWFNWPVLKNLTEKHELRIVARRMNAPWSTKPLVGSLLEWCAGMWPNLFALSFVITCEK